MTQVSEQPRAAAQMLASLRDGLEQLDLNQEVQFQGYTRLVLPLDGFVFWSPTVKYTFKGSLHFSQDMEQSEEETVGYATVIFTSQCPITEFDGPANTIYVAGFAGFRFSFSHQQVYRQAGLYHYVGHSIYPALATQLLDDPSSIDPDRAVTSNSMALWLSLNAYPAPFYDWFSNDVTLYPADLVQPNLVPPYGVVDIQDTRALQAVPYLSAKRNHYQLVSDRVRVTLYGLQSNEALDFVDTVLQYSAYSDNFGIMNMPVVIDDKRPQPELQAIAMKKHIDFEISYHQIRVADIARQLITKAITTLIVGTDIVS